jgi:hypothetical protein
MDVGQTKNMIFFGDFVLTPDKRCPKTIGLSGVCRVFFGKSKLLKFFLEI